MNTQVNKQVLMMSEEGRGRMLEGLRAGFSRELRAKVRYQDGRFRLTLKGVGEKFDPQRHEKRFLGCNLSDGVRAMLLQSGYNQEHVLEPGAGHEVVLYYGDEFGHHMDRTKTNIRSLARAEFGHNVNVSPPAELAFLIRTMFTFAEMQMLGLEYMAVLHADIEGGVQSNQLFSKTNRGDPWMQAWVAGPDVPWEGGGGFAFSLA